jgi:tetratricopeptide (TPR) repeat protein
LSPADRAEAPYDAAREIWERLAAANPREPEYQTALAKCWNNLGVLYRRSDRPENAETAYQRAVALRERMTREHPDVPDYQNELAASYSNLGGLNEDADGQRTCTPQGDPVSLKKPGEWNDYHILARRHHMILKVNGQVSAEFIDNDTTEFDPSGILGLQLRSGPPMKVQFKEILP